MFTPNFGSISLANDICKTNDIQIKNTEMSGFGWSKQEILKLKIIQTIDSTQPV